MSDQAYSARVTSPSAGPEADHDLGDLDEDDPPNVPISLDEVHEPPGVGIAPEAEDNEDSSTPPIGRLKLKIALQLDHITQDDTLYCAIPLALPRMHECLEVKTAVCVAADNSGVVGERHSWGELCLRKPVGEESGPRHRVFVHEGDTVDEGLYQEHHMTFSADHPLCRHLAEGTLLQFWIRIGGAGEFDDVELGGGMVGLLQSLASNAPGLGLYPGAALSRDSLSMALAFVCIVLH